MHPTLRLCAAGTGRLRPPLIHFLGKRQWPATPAEPHAHPSAPPEVKQSFGSFLQKFQASGSASAGAAAKTESNVQVYEEFWEAPERLWKNDLQDWEIELIASGGASRY